MLCTCDAGAMTDDKMGFKHIHTNPSVQEATAPETLLHCNCTGLVLALSLPSTRSLLVSVPVMMRKRYTLSIASASRASISMKANKLMEDAIDEDPLSLSHCVARQLS